MPLTLTMTSAQVVETSVTNNSSFQNYTHPDDHTMRKTISCCCCCCCCFSFEPDIDRHGIGSRNRETHTAFLENVCVYKN